MFVMRHLVWLGGVQKTDLYCLALKAKRALEGERRRMESSSFVNIQQAEQKGNQTQPSPTLIFSSVHGKNIANYKCIAMLFQFVVTNVTSFKMVPHNADNEVLAHSLFEGILTT